MYSLVNLYLQIKTTGPNLEKIIEEQPDKPKGYLNSKNMGFDGFDIRIIFVNVSTGYEDDLHLKS